MVSTRRGTKAITEEHPLDPVKKERDDAIKRVEELLEELRDERRARKDAVSEFNASRESEGRLQNKVDELRAAKEGLEQASKTVWGRHKEVVDQLAKLKGSLTTEMEVKEKQSAELKALQTIIASLKKASDEKSRELGHLQTAHRDMQSLLDTRTRELRDAQVYLVKTDSVSHADIHRMVERLNSLIFQLSAQIADDFAFAEDRPYGDSLAIAYANIARFIGEPIATLLCTTSHVEDSAWVQLGLQAILAVFSSWLITTWDPRFDDVKNSLLTDIHRELFTTGERYTTLEMVQHTDILCAEPQTVSARWRGLVRRSVRRLGNGHDTTSYLIDQTMVTLADVLRISGAKDIVFLAEGVDRYRDKVRDLVLQSSEIQRAIGEEVSSSDFQVICPPFSGEFCADSMENVDDCGRGKSRISDDGRVLLCCTELGLRRCENVAGRDGGRGEGEGEGEIISTTLIKAKVALRDDGGEGRGA